MKHRPNLIDYRLTDREKELLHAASVDPALKGDGTFAIDTDTFQCDRCESRLPHNRKLGLLHVTDCYITTDGGILCRLCKAACPDLFIAVSPGLATGGHTNA